MLRTFDTEIVHNNGGADNLAIFRKIVAEKMRKDDPKKKGSEKFFLFDGILFSCRTQMCAVIYHTGRIKQDFPRKHKHCAGDRLGRKNVDSKKDGVLYWIQQNKNRRIHIYECQ